MENIKKVILEAVPEAVIEDKTPLTVTVEPNKLRHLVKALRNYAEMPFDYLAMLTGTDEGEMLMVTYLLCPSTDLSKEIAVKTGTADRVNPLLYTVTDIWETAHYNEREVFAMLGIRFINNPDMRRFFLNSDWVGFPLRKDYDASPVKNPVSIESKDIIDTAPRIVEMPDGKLKEERVDIFEKDDYIINIGPQHPSTHGVMHFRVALEGEIVKKIDVHSGYIHRGIEKLSEKLTYPQILHFTDRLDYLSANINRHGLCMCVEKAAQIEVPGRAQYIRTIMDELNRIDSHLVAWGTMCMDLGSTTAFIYGMREREDILKIFEKNTGGRLIINYNVLGGVMFDIQPDFQSDVKAFIPVMRKALVEYDKLFTGNVIAVGRMKGLGLLSKEEAISYAVTGPAGRASGFSCDIRKHIPYALYDKVEFNEVIRENGDSFDRYLNRLEEIEESLKIIEQLIDNIPDGDYLAKTKAIIKLPEGEYYQRVEAGRGEFGVYIESRGDKTPYRLKFRSPSMAAVSAMPLICADEKISDFIGIGGSMDYVIPDIDR
ncbi:MULTISPECIES: NADH-quinone oxidoreductase subunit D [Dysgonomonas]|uniref:NADH-quinone oxidoreductase subunit D n=1 Tax=Dysgonomonas TaxID=156973 RepID=UPI00092B446E|nr:MULTISPECIES: NADH-quinone oxidoreductase subunit D [Dysgonomonas]MBN9301066.1 NADH-quinone oxidoreductase subunit D [Dysgonomonas mossii]OJX58199.1 MAG: NADH-quinone oxidoreductase subunit C [Dysgonomonas sp. 37-18]